jgi:peroxiredoxin
MVTDSLQEESCKKGIKVGKCPKDFALPNRDGELVSLHAQRGQRVAVIGSALF